MGNRRTQTTSHPGPSRSEHGLNRYSRQWHERVFFSDSSVLSVDEHHLLVYSDIHAMHRLHVTDPDTLPASVEELLDSQEPVWVTITTDQGLRGLDRLRGTGLTVFGDLSDPDPLYAVSDTFMHIDLTGVWGRGLRRLDSTKVGSPRVLSAKGRTLRAGDTLSTRTIALVVEDFQGVGGEDLPASDHLRHVAILTARNLESWSDVGALFPRLVELEVYAAGRLRGRDIGGLPAGMLSLDFQACRGLREIPFVADLPDLRHLALTDCKSIATVAPLAHCQRLESFVANGDTKIEDGDLSVLIERSMLPRVALRRSRHYQPPLQTLERILPEWEGFIPFEKRGDDLDLYWPDRLPEQ